MFYGAAPACPCLVQIAWARNSCLKQQSSKQRVSMLTLSPLHMPFFRPAPCGCHCGDKDQFAHHRRLVRCPGGQLQGMAWHGMAGRAAAHAHAQLCSLCVVGSHQSNLASLSQISGAVITVASVTTYMWWQWRLSKRAADGGPGCQEQVKASSSSRGRAARCDRVGDDAV